MAEQSSASIAVTGGVVDGGRRIGAQARAASHGAHAADGLRGLAPTPRSNETEGGRAPAFRGSISAGGEGRLPGGNSACADERCRGLGSVVASLAASRTMIQITPQMRVLVAVEPVDLRKGIDGLAALYREKLHADPFSGWLFLFRGRRATAIRVLVYDGQGFWMAHK